MNENINVFSKNKRKIQEIWSDHFGWVAIVAVGATLIGSITFKGLAGDDVSKGSPHGHFSFGGSTVLVFFQKGRIIFDRDLTSNSKEGRETLVRVNTRLGVAPADSDPVADREEEEKERSEAEKKKSEELKKWMEQEKKRASLLKKLPEEERRWEEHRFRLDLCMVELERQLQAVLNLNSNLKNFKVEKYLKLIEESWEKLDDDENGLLDRQELAVFIWTQTGKDAADLPEKLPRSLSQKVETVLNGAGGKGYFTFWDYANMRIPPPFNRHIEIKEPPKERENLHPNTMAAPESWLKRMEEEDSE